MKNDKTNRKEVKTKTALSSIIYIAISAIICSFGQIFYKFGANRLTDFYSFILNPFVYLGIGCYGIGLLFMIKALRRGELSVIYPIMATSFIWVCLLSPIFFHSDYMTPIKWVGIIIIMTGVSFVGIGGRK